MKALTKKEPKSSNELTRAEQSELEMRETRMEKNREDFKSDLIQIHAKKLYRQNGRTFEDYCKTRWGYSERRAYQLINAAAVNQQLAEKNLNHGSVSERVARELAKVPPEKRQEAIDEAARNGPVTAKAIAQAAKASKPAKEKPIECDEKGNPIPENCLEWWHRRQELQDLMTTVSRVKSAIQHGLDEKDFLYLRVAQMVPDHLTRVHGFLSDAKPYAVCPICNGHLKDNCKECHGIGMLTRQYYEAANTRLKMMSQKAK